MVLAMIVALAGCGEPSATPVIASITPAPTATTAPTPTTAPAPTPEPEPCGNACNLPSPTTAQTLVPDFQPIKLSGSGNKVPTFTVPANVSGVATITNSGSHNFAVWSLAADGSELDLLVNVIGNYSGSVMFDKESGQHSVAFKVESSGSWTITVKPLQLARPWDSVSKLSGTGDDVILLPAPISALKTATITHAGSHNFAVWAYTASGADLLVNTIGKYSGDSQLPPGTVLLVIEADGPWTVTPL